MKLEDIEVGETGEEKEGKESRGELVHQRINLASEKLMLHL